MADAVSDEEDGLVLEGANCHDEARAASHEDKEDFEEELLVITRAALGCYAQPDDAEDIPLAAVRSHLFSRDRPGRVSARPSESPADAFARTCGLRASISSKAARGRGPTGTRVLGAGSPSEHGQNACFSVLSGTEARIDLPSQAVPAKRIQKPPRTRVVDFTLFKSFSSDDVGPIDGEAAPKQDEWGKERSVERQAELKFAVFGSIYNCVRQCLLHNGFRAAQKGDADWNIFWGRPLRLVEFSELDQFQKVNHFPGSNVFGRKDHLARACQRARRVWGVEEMDFLPKTWVLPSERNELSSDVGEAREGKQMYIVKPPDGCKGSGIRIYNDPIAHTKSSAACVVSHYIANPLLIDGNKFDIRLYVAVTCFQPLRVYIHEQGLVRLCTATYSASSKRSARANKFSHLTNYAVNKNSSDFVSNKSASEDNQGHKWSLRALKEWMKGQNIDPGPIFYKIDKLIVKTLMAGEGHINTCTALHVPNRNTCFELLGFDILIDSNLKPWLLEVNTSPSLACDTPLDATTKSQVVTDTLHLVRLQQYSRTELDEWLNSERRLRMQGEKTQRRHLADNKRRREVCSGLLGPLLDLTEEDADVIREAEEEFKRTGGFRRVFPCADALTREVSSLFETKRFNNFLLIHWVNRGNELTVQDYLDGKHAAVKNPDPLFKPPQTGNTPCNSTLSHAQGAAAAGGSTRSHQDAVEKLRKDASGRFVSPMRVGQCSLSGSHEAGDRSGAANHESEDVGKPSSAQGVMRSHHSHVHMKLSAAQAERFGLFSDHRRSPSHSLGVVHRPALSGAISSDTINQQPSGMEDHGIRAGARAGTDTCQQLQVSGSAAVLVELMHPSAVYEPKWTAGHQPELQRPHTSPRSSRGIIARPAAQARANNTVGDAAGNGNRERSKFISEDPDPPRLSAQSHPIAVWRDLLEEPGSPLSPQVLSPLQEPFRIEGTMDSAVRNRRVSSNITSGSPRIPSSPLAGSTSSPHVSPCAESDIEEQGEHPRGMKSNENSCNDEFEPWRTRPSTSSGWSYRASPRPGFGMVVGSGTGIGGQERRLSPSVVTISGMQMLPDNIVNTGTYSPSSSPLSGARGVTLPFPKTSHCGWMLQGSNPEDGAWIPLPSPEPCVHPGGASVGKSAGVAACSGERQSQSLRRIRALTTSFADRERRRIGASRKDALRAQSLPVGSSRSHEIFSLIRTAPCPAPGDAMVLGMQGRGIGGATAGRRSSANSSSSHIIGLKGLQANGTR